MVKIGALIGAFFVTIGTFVQSIYYVSIIINTNKLESVQGAMYMLESSADPLLVSSILVFFLGIILVLGSGFVKGKLFLVIGGGIMIIGYLTMMIPMLSGAFYSLGFIIGSFIMVLGVILYFVGCIHFRKHNIVAVITGFLLMIAVLCSQFIGLIFSFSGERLDHIWFRIHFITLSVQAVFFTLHSWVFVFSKKIVDYSDEVDDTLSDENGVAFASYVSDDMEKKKDKSKIPPESDEITFTF